MVAKIVVSGVPGRPQSRGQVADGGGEDLEDGLGVGRVPGRSVGGAVMRGECTDGPRSIGIGQSNRRSRCQVPRISSRKMVHSRPERVTTL